MTEYVRIYGEEGPTCGECGSTVRMPDHVDPLEIWQAPCPNCGEDGSFQDEAGDPDFAIDAQELDFNE